MEVPFEDWLHVVDEDINPWNADAVNWAICLRHQPDRDTKIITRTLGQDHSAIPCDQPIRDPSLKEPLKGKRLLIDAAAAAPPSFPTASSRFLMPNIP